MSDEQKQEIYEYWNNRQPYGWGEYEEMRTLKYGLHSYWLTTFDFEKWNGKRILEIGCGCGIDAVEYAKHGAQVYATDLTENAVRETQELFDLLNLEPAEIRQVDATQGLPYEDAFFDMVYSIGVIHHSPEPKKIVSEASRVLKPGGSMYALLYHKDSLLYYFSILYIGGIVKHGFSEGLTEKQLLAKYSEATDGCPYTDVYTVQQAKELFAPYFEYVDVAIEHPAIDTMTERKKLPPDVPKNLGWHLIIKAVK